MEIKSLGNDNQQNSQMPLEDYEILEKIGKGRYASVYHVRRLSDNLPFALKRMQLRQMTLKERRNVMGQARLLSAVQHPHIIGLIEVFYDQFIEALCLVLELAEKDLGKEVQARKEQGKAFAEEQIWKFLGHISLGLQFLHYHNVVHRDIKTHNVLLFSGGNTKISDFNISRKADGLMQTRAGTFACASPQIWKGQLYDAKADIWSLGCLVYELITLQKPFQAEDMLELHRKIAKSCFSKITNENYSKQLRDLVSFMLQVNPKLRPSANTLVKICSKRSQLGEVYPCKPSSFHFSALIVPGLQNIDDQGLDTPSQPIKKRISCSQSRQLAPLNSGLKKSTQFQAVSRSRYLKQGKPTLDWIRKEAVINKKLICVYIQKAGERKADKNNQKKYRGLSDFFPLHQIDFLIQTVKKQKYVHFIEIF